MIQLNHINIRFTKTVIEDSSITIHNGKITAITGDSGTGKTSLLYHLGLISSFSDYEYFLDDTELDLKNSLQMSDIRRRKFGYLFQDNSLFETLTIQENIKLIANLSGIEPSTDEMVFWLNYVDLSKEYLSAYPRQLSGGELQRVALACILSKKPEYLFADEPTSALDETNSKKVIEILKKLSQQGVTVVIATHSSMLCAEADVVYSIIDNKLCLQNKDTIQKTLEISGNRLESKERNTKFGVKHLFRYAINTKRKARFINAIIIFFCAIAITGYSLTNSVLIMLQETQKDIIEGISDREVFVVNPVSDDDAKRDTLENIAIEQDEINAILEIDGVQEIFPYYEFRSFNLTYTPPVIGSTIRIESNLGVDSIDVSLDDQNFPYFIVVPYIENQKLDQRLDIKIDDGEIYISHSMAQMLNLDGDDYSSLNLLFDICIPVKKMERVSSSSKENVDISVSKSLNLNISGILNDNVLNRYSINGNNMIFVPYDKLNEILEQTIIEHANDDYSAYTGDFVVKEWSASAYIVFTDSYKNVNTVKGKIENINENFVTRCDFQDTEAISELINNISKTTNVILFILLVIIFVLMSSVYIIHTVGRRKEIALLKANGMNSKHIVYLMLIESVMQGIKILLVSTLFSILLSVIASKILLNSFQIFSLRTFVHVLIMAFFYVLFPSLASVLFAIRVQPAAILRN